MPLTKITGGEFDNTQGGLSVAGIITATSFNGDGASLTGIFPVGTLMLFQQTTAPTGWTKQTTHNDKALRVVTGAASSGGTTAFSSVMASRTPAGSVTMSNAAFTLGTNEIPSHRHGVRIEFGTNQNLNQGVPGQYNQVTNNTGYGFQGDPQVELIGGGGSHTHSNTASFSGTALDFAIQYVDLIIASKN
jgi:hypothetical protein